MWFQLENMETWVLAVGFAAILGVIGFAVATSRGNKRRQRARERNTTFNPMDFIDSLGTEGGQGSGATSQGNRRRSGQGAGEPSEDLFSAAGLGGDQNSQTTAHGAQSDSTPQILVLYVMARGSGEFRCSGVNRVLTRAECVLDERGVFSLKNEEHDVVFSVVNALEPATFDAASMDITTTRGVAFFFEARGRGDKRRFDAMLSIARKLALEIEGELLDEKREALSSVREAALRSDLSD